MVDLWSLFSLLVFLIWSQTLSQVQENKEARDDIFELLPNNPDPSSSIQIKHWQLCIPFHQMLKTAFSHRMGGHFNKYISQLIWWNEVFLHYSNPYFRLCRLQMDRSYYRYHVDFCRWIGVTTDIMLIFADGSELLQISCWFLQMDRSYYRYHVDFCRGITSINQLNMLSLF